MKEFIDKLIERLEEKKDNCEHNQKVFENKRSLRLATICEAKAEVYKDAIAIVNELAEEYNNESVKGDLISRSAVIRELNGIYLDNPYDDKEDILEKAIGIVDHFPAPYTEGE